MKHLVIQLVIQVKTHTLTLQLIIYITFILEVVVEEHLLLTEVVGLVVVQMVHLVEIVLMVLAEIVEVRLIGHILHQVIHSVYMLVEVVEVVGLALAVLQHHFQEMVYQEVVVLKV
jgi:hypothetical protein